TKAGLEERGVNREKARLPRWNSEPAVGCVVVEVIQRLADRNGEALPDGGIPAFRLPSNRPIEAQIHAEHRHDVVAPPLHGRNEILREAFLTDQFEERVYWIEVGDHDSLHRESGAVFGLNFGVHAPALLD